MRGYEPVDHDALEGVLRALAYSSRLELLGILRTPTAVQDIYLTPRQVRPGENPERAVTRQTLQAHLDKLVEAGLVTVSEEPGPARRRKVYAANPQRFYQVVEEFRKVGAITRDAPVAREDTVDLGPAPAPALHPGPKLLLVRGLAEGLVFPLQVDELRDGRGWVVGRKENVHVSLAYDPYVSLENAEVLPDAGGGFKLLDLRASKNGTWLNWDRLDRGEEVALTPGDVIGVGRSALVFRGE